MAVGEYLPPVITRLSGDIGDFADMIAEAKALMKGLNGDAEINIGADLDKASVTKALADVVSITDSFNGANIRIGAEVNDASLLAALAEIKTAVGTLGTAAGVDSAAGAGGRLLFGWLNANTLHWLISGSAEILAVAVPAFIALGAGAAVAAQGAQNAYEHLSALYTTTEATANIFHTTAGQVLGMGDALQQAQNAANPDVYSVLGSAIITVKEHFGDLANTGLQVVQMFQTFAAKVAVDFSPSGGLGGTTTKLLANMTSDLRGLGQVFGNTGHALLNFASDMPGLAEVLLKVLDGVTGLASHLTGVAGPLITVAMGFEEFNRWGSLAVTVLSKVGLASADLQGGALTLTRFKTVVQGLLSIFPTAIAYMAKFAATLGASGAAEGLTGAAEGLAGAIDKITPLGAILGTGAAVGLGILIDKLVTAQDQTQRFVSSLQQATQQSSNVNAFQTITQNVAQLQEHFNQATATVKNQSQALTQLSSNYRGNLSVALSLVKAPLQELSQGLTQQEQDAANVTQGAVFLARTYGTTLVGALSLADEANVKLTNGILGTGQNAEIARMQIASYVTGLQAMGSPMSAVGSDMTALAIQSGLASSKVSSLNQAWDQFMQNLTGGTGGLSSFTQSLANMGTTAATVSNNLGEGKGISLSVQQFAASLKSFTGSGATAWQNFDQVVGSTAPQLIDWFRTAGAEGALSGTQFTNAVLGMVSSLTQLASESPTAQAELLGLVQMVDPNIQTWGQLTQKIQQTHANLSDTTNAVQIATQKMGDMSAVAQNLGTVMQNSLLTTLSQAKIQASGAGAAMQQYEQDIMNAGTSASKTAGDRATLIKDLENLGYTAKQAAEMIQMVSNNINDMPTSKDISINIHEYVTTSGKTANATLNPGYASGTSGASPGWAWVGEAGPELVRFKGGEQVVPNSVARGYAGGTGDGNIHVHVHLDGRQISSAVASRAVQTQRRTGHNGMTKRTR